MSPLAVEVHNRTRYAVDEAAVEGLARAVLAAEGVAAGELGVTFVGERRMRALNRDYRQVDRATDVLAFPLEEAGEVAAPAVAGAAVPPRLLGDVVVCPRVAQRQARAHGLPLPFEIAVLLVHGVLHVLGHDHDRGVGGMAARQAELLEGVDWGALGVAPR